MSLSMCFFCYINFAKTKNRYEKATFDRVFFYASYFIQ
jgi:hypothetical protein